VSVNSSEGMNYYMNITTTALSHLGLVSGTFDQLGIADLIDTAIPKNRNHNLSHSAVIKAMCLNGLGFNESRLYLYPEYFEKLPTERLLGEGILPEHINDDVLGRTLDKIYEYGCTELFNQIVLKAMKSVSFGNHILHTDTTNFSLHGNYENRDPELDTIEITYGHPKDKRWDLKRFVLSMVCNQEGIPLFVETLSGNASDKTTLVKTVKKIQKNLKLDDKVYHIADSAIYSDDNITELGERTLWITRVPATITEVKDLLNADIELKVCTDVRYSCYETTSSYGGMQQKWVLFQSKEMKKRKEKTFDRNIKKELKTAQKSLNKLKKMEYACEEDANRAAEKWLNEHQMYLFKQLSIEPKSRRIGGKRGRPKKGEELETFYSIKAKIKVDKQIIAQKRKKLGRFVLATNDLDLTVDEILSYYKSQGNVERGFMFLKDKSFHVSEVYLKKESRIEALSMIMVLCLFLYSIAQWKLRSRLKETNKFVRNQVKKPIQNPTMRWVFFLFSGITEFTILLDGIVEKRVANMTDELWDILSLMGKECEKYYV
jgi:transposase